ncbi:MAG: hypothetical protein IPJ34_07250 [Myxococcales bacterium]|nr:hypothetical protein [Myxococcales bacterium]
MDRTRVLRRIALLGVGLTSACGAKVAPDPSPALTDDGAVPRADAASPAVTDDTAVPRADGDGLADSVVADAAESADLPMRCVGLGSDAGACSPGSHCWPATVGVVCTPTAPDAGDAGTRCGDGWCGGGMSSSYFTWCELPPGEAICHVDYRSAGGPLLPPDLVS